MHYSRTLSLDHAFLQQLITLLGKQQFGYAIRIARLNIGITKGHQKQILDDLLEQNENT